MREKRIPKDNGKERILGIPTVADRIAQGAVKRYVEAALDPIFHADSYGYRLGKSAHDGVGLTSNEDRTLQRLESLGLERHDLSR